MFSLGGHGVIPSSLLFSLSLQAMAALLEPSVFLYALIYKFRLDTWLARSVVVM